MKNSHENLSGCIVGFSSNVERRDLSIWAIERWMEDGYGGHSVTLCVVP